MISRREIFQVGAAAAAVAAANGLGSLGRALAQQRLTAQELLRFDSVGNVTLLHIADLQDLTTRDHIRRACSGEVVAGSPTRTCAL